MHALLILLALGLADPISIPTSWSKRERAVAARVDAKTIADHVRVLADDKFEGRGPGTHGAELAVKYIAEQYERLKLAPAGSDGYLQRFEIVGMKSSVKSPPTFRGKNGELTCSAA